MLASLQSDENAYMQTEPRAASTSPASILLVEDDADVRSTLGDLLRDEGYVVASCSNAFDALERLHQAALPDVILLDRSEERRVGKECCR